MSLVEYDYMVKTFATYTTVQPLNLRILPGGTRRSDDFFDVHVFHPFTEYVAVDTVTISEQKPGNLVIRECLDYLLCHPLSRRVGRDVEVYCNASVGTGQLLCLGYF